MRPAGAPPHEAFEAHFEPETRKAPLSGAFGCTLAYIHKKREQLHRTPLPGGPRSASEGHRGGAPPTRLADLATGENLSDALALLAHERQAHSAADWKVSDRDRLLAIFAHDLRTLLTVLTLNAKLFLSHEGDAAEENGDRMKRAIARMDRLLSDLVDLAMLNQGQLRTTLRPSDLSIVLHEAIDCFRPLALAKSLTLSLAGADGPIAANLDHDRMFQVLSNLLSNAIKFTPSGGDIVLSVSTIHRLVRVEVRDTGPGIPQEDLRAIFECYRQLEGAAREGLGLGLFISRAILTAHMGRIWAESRLGSGSTFVFVLPGLDVELSPTPA